MSADTSLFGRLRGLADASRPGLSDAQIDQLEAYLLLLRRWNGSINLTALDTTHFPDLALERLIGEPLRATQLLDRCLDSSPGELRWIDIGSGSGSPAIPMKVAMPSMQLTMVESRGRKASFLREAVRHVGLPTASVAASRIEDVADGSRTADLVSMRGVRLDVSVVGAAKTLLPDGGCLLVIGSDDVGGLKGAFSLIAEDGPVQLFRKHVSRGTL